MKLHKPSYRVIAGITRYFNNKAGSGENWPKNPHSGFPSVSTLIEMMSLGPLMPRTDPGQGLRMMKVMQVQAFIYKATKEKLENLSLLNTITHFMGEM